MFAAMNTGHRGVMGTVHANSARETIVRLTSPPISVPPIMISSLNLIVMQNRIHDRRKGTLRRITEIAELAPTDDGEKQELQVLYSYDPVKDEMFETGRPSLYFQQLKRYTGLSDEELKQEIVDRARILKDLSNKNVRSLTEVCDVTQNYVATRRLKL
ncbi:MAG: ATPase, T2SS/T4P/T4SS family [Candidatus Micrarchaeota archaeon]